MYLPYSPCGGRQSLSTIAQHCAAVIVEAAEAADPRIEARGCSGPVSASVKCGSSAADQIWVTIVVLS